MHVWSQCRHECLLTQYLDQESGLAYWFWCSWLFQNLCSFINWLFWLIAEDLSLKSEFEQHNWLLSVFDCLIVWLLQTYMFKYDSVHSRRKYHELKVKDERPFGIRYNTTTGWLSFLSVWSAQALMMNKQERFQTLSVLSEQHGKGG